MYIYIYLIAIFQYSIIYNNYSNTTGIESIQLTSFSSHRACRRAQWPWRNSHFPRQAKLAPGSKLGRYLNAWIDQVSWRCNWQDGSNALTNGTSKDRLWGKKNEHMEYGYYFQECPWCFFMFLLSMHKHPEKATLSHKNPVANWPTGHATEITCLFSKRNAMIISGFSSNITFRKIKNKTASNRQPVIHGTFAGEHKHTIECIC